MRNIDEETASDFFSRLAEIFKSRLWCGKKRKKNNVNKTAALKKHSIQDLRNQCLHLKLLRTDEAYCSDLMHP